jgi:foldase protein PrsA
MLDFFRRHAEKIIITTLAAFVLSIGIIGMFSRTNKYTGGKNGLEKKVVGELATVNNREINHRYFIRMYNAGIMQYKPQYQKDPLDPKIEAYLRYNAVMQTIDFEKNIFFAKKMKVKVSGRELNAQIDAILNSYKIKSRREFKDLLAKNGYTWGDFLRDIKQEMIINKMFMAAKQKVMITDNDVKNQFKKVKARHILISVQPGDDQEAQARNEKNARDKIAYVYDQLSKGKDFSALAKEFSEDKGSAAKGGDLGWFSAGMMVPEFEDVAFALQKGQFSKPIETPYGLHIIKVEDIQQNDIPIDIDEKELKQKLLQTKQEEAVRRLHQQISRELPHELDQSIVVAYDNRVKGNLDKALTGYRQLASQNPQSPIPYLFTADIFEQQKKYTEAMAEYKRALLIEKLNPATKSAFTHFYLGKMYAKQKLNGLAAKEYALAGAALTDDMGTMERLKEAYKDIGYTKESTKMDLKVKAIQNALKLAQGKDLDLEDLDQKPTKNAKGK